MTDNNFVTRQLEKTAKQIMRKYYVDGLTDKISVLRFHQEEHCPCCDIELDSLDRIDLWQWRHVGNGFNGWVLVGTDTLYESEETADEQDADAVQEVAEGVFP